MKADFTRNPFHPEKHFARVLMQQGRVQMDADWNEQATILLHYMQSLAADLIGPFGGPAKHLGFEVSPFPTPPVVSGDFLLSPGHYYVNGILCENDPQPVPVTLVAGQKQQVVVGSWTVDRRQFAKGQLVELHAAKDASPPVLAHVTDTDQAASTITLDEDLSALKPAFLRRVTTYLTQADWPVAGPLTKGKYFVYLDVWERVITYVEDDSIREVALNGADTAARSKVVWQVKVGPSGMDPAASPHLSNRGFLKARSVKTTASGDPCIIAPNARYRGPENQLYRVEIHTGSLDAAGNSAKPTFKWSRENGAVVYPIVRSTGTNSFILESLGRDDRFGLAEGDWVEIQDDDSVLQNRAETLLAVQTIDRSSMSITLAGTASANTGKSPALHPLLRRWDYQFGDPSEGGLAKGSDNAALVVEDNQGWLDLENGVQIQFQTAGSRPGRGTVSYGRLLADSRARRHRRCRMADRTGCRCAG